MLALLKQYIHSAGRFYRRIKPLRSLPIWLDHRTKTPPARCLGSRIPPRRPPLRSSIMFFSRNTIQAFALAALANVRLVSSAPTGHAQSQPKAVYFMTNTPQNNIIALPVAQDGTLAQGTMTPTGGQGLQGTNAMTGQPAAPDGLSSQDSVVVAGRVRYAGSFLVSCPADQSCSTSLQSTRAQIPCRCSR